MKRIFLAALFWLLLTPIVYGQTFVKDESNTLSADELKNLSDYVSSVSSQSDIRLGLLIKNSLDTEPKAVATGTINAWEMGTRSAILLVSFHPRKLYIQPGSDFSGALDLPTCQSICQNIIAPKMRTGSVQQAVLAGLVSMHDTIKSRPNAHPVKATNSAQHVDTGFSTGAIIVIILAIILALFILILIINWLSGPRYYSSGDGFWSGYFFGSLTSSDHSSSSWSDSSSGGGSDWGGSSDGGGGGGSSW